MDAARGRGSGGEEDEGEDVGGGDTEEEITVEELLGPNCPMLVLPSEEGGLRVNPRLEIGPLQHEVLRQWGVAVDESGNLIWKGMENDTDDHQNSTTNRKTCDEGDSQDKNHASKSGRGGK